MDEDRVVRVLEEIRDLQRQQVEAYGRAIANQQESMRAQKQAIANARRLQLTAGIVIIFVIFVVLVLLRYVLIHYR
jgi:uncharacterized membrane protein